MTTTVKGCYIVLEGADGCGKGTQAKLLADRLGQTGITVRHVREPGGTVFGEKIRAALLDNDSVPTPLAELFAFLAARANLLQTVVRPLLEEGVWVLSERSTASTYVYQGLARGLDEVNHDRPDLGSRHFRDAVNWAASPAPVDLTIILDIPTERSAARLRNREAAGQQADRFELADNEFQRKINAGYRQLADLLPTAVSFVDGVGTQAEVAQRVWDMLADWAAVGSKLPGVARQSKWNPGKPFYEESVS